MRILLINPNSDAAMTDAIRRKAESFANGEYEVVAVSTPGASKFVATYEDHAKAAPGMVDLVRQNRDAFDAFVIACHGELYPTWTSSRSQPFSAARPTCSSPRHVPARW